MAVRFTAVDLDTGDTSTVDIQPGDFVLVAVAPCRVDSEQHHANGTTVITLKGRTVPVTINGMREISQTRATVA